MIRPTSANAETRDMNEQERTELEAAAFRRLVQHLRTRPDVQNIELMMVADFCRNCLAKWYSAAASEKGLAFGYAEAQEMVYGMPYAEWKTLHQREATSEQLQAFEERQRRKQLQEQQQQ